MIKCISALFGDQVGEACVPELYGVGHAVYPYPEGAASCRGIEGEQGRLNAFCFIIDHIRRLVHSGQGYTVGSKLFFC